MKIELQQQPGNKSGTNKTTSSYLNIKTTKKYTCILQNNDYINLQTIYKTKNHITTIQPRNNSQSNEITLSYRKCEINQNHQHITKNKIDN